MLRLIYLFEHGHLAYQIDGNGEQNRVQVKFPPYGLTGNKSISNIFIPNFVYVLTNKRYETHRTKFSFCRLSCPRVGLGGYCGGGGGQALKRVDLRWRPIGYVF